jgi:hypothetical protein
MYYISKFCKDYVQLSRVAFYDEITADCKIKLEVFSLVN